MCQLLLVGGSLVQQGLWEEIVVAKHLVLEKFNNFFICILSSSAESVAKI